MLQPSITSACLAAKAALAGGCRRVRGRQRPPAATRQPPEFAAVNPLRRVPSLLRRQRAGLRDGGGPALPRRAAAGARPRAAARGARPARLAALDDVALEHAPPRVSPAPRPEAPHSTTRPRTRGSDFKGREKLAAHRAYLERELAASNLVSPRGVLSRRHVSLHAQALRELLRPLHAPRRETRRPLRARPRLAPRSLARASSRTSMSGCSATTPAARRVPSTEREAYGI